MKFAALSLCVLLTACGGAEPPTLPSPPVGVSFFGDSLTSGSLDNGGHLDVLPVVRMTQLSDGAFVGRDYSYPGATVWDARDGAPGLPYVNFGDALLDDDSRIIVIRFIASALARGGDQEVEYAQVLTMMVGQVRAAGKLPVFVGAHHLVPPPERYGISLADAMRIMGNIDRFEVATKQVAEDAGVLFIETRLVPFYGAVDIADSIHPTQAYSDRMSAFIVAGLLPLLKDLPNDNHQNR